MMNMDKVLAYLAIRSFKVTSTYQTLIAFLSYAFLTSLLIALILVDIYLHQSPFVEFLVILRIIYIVDIIIDQLMRMQQEIK